MQVKEYSDDYLKELVHIYNKSKKNDSDFRPLNINEFKSKFIDLPYKGKIFKIVLIKDDKPIGFLVADCDVEVERKFGKKIAIIDLLLANEDFFYEASQRLISELENRLKRYNIEEIQAHFIDEKNLIESEFFNENFELVRRWCYMECDVYKVDKDELILPEGLYWEIIKFKGRNANAKKWLSCYNEAFENHFGMRPLSYEELKSYTYEISFDQEAYFGIYSKELKDFVAECSCEIDLLLNDYRKINRCIIWTVGVRKAYRGRGFGKMLVLKALDYMNKRNVKTAAIHVDEENNIAYNLYRKLGFKTKRYRLFFRKVIR